MRAKLCSRYRLMLPAGPPYSADKELINELVESVWHLAHMHPRVKPSTQPSIQPTSSIQTKSRAYARTPPKIRFLSNDVDGKRTSYFTQTKRRITDNSSANDFFFVRFLGFQRGTAVAAPPDRQMKVKWFLITKANRNPPPARQASARKGDSP